PAINVSLIELEQRFRIIMNSIECIEIKQKLPKLPVARAIWIPEPDLKTSATAWILAGGAHHTAFSQQVLAECVKDLAEIIKIECIHIDKNSSIPKLKNELRWNDFTYK
ncbi:MAG TPA: L-arabinose isomerase, partial [Victivallales bacterium]|nr:L-arabinose isomerase [Victivallales bacterium]